MGGSLSSALNDLLWERVLYRDLSGKSSLSPEIMTALGLDQAFNAIFFFLTDFSDRIGKTKRTGYESGEYEMVCCVCVNGNGAVILSSRTSRDTVGFQVFL